MRAGIGSYAFRHAIGYPTLKDKERMSFCELIEYCAENSVEALQVCENLPLHLLSDHQLSDGLALLNKYSITFEVGTTGFAADHLKIYASIARSLGSNILRTIVDAKGVTINQIADQIKLIIPTLEKTNVTLAIENHFHLTPGELRVLIEKIGHPLVKICIDPLNSITLLHCINETYEQLKPYIVSAHVKDVRLKRTGLGFQIFGCPLGEGISKVDEYLRKIYESNPACNVFIEHWMDTCSNTEDTLAREKIWVTSSLEFLKNCINHLTCSIDGNTESQ